MKRTEIQKMATKIVMERLAEGYELAFSNQRVGLINIFLEKEGERPRVVFVENGYAIISHGIVRTTEIKESYADGAYVLWNSDDLISKQTLYKISRSNEDDYYTDSVEEVMAIKEKRQKRFNLAQTLGGEYIKVSDKLLKLIKQKVGYKRVTVDKLKVYRDDDCYIIKTDKKQYSVRFPIKCC